MPNINGVKNPHTGQQARINKTTIKTPNPEAVGMTRGQ